MKVETVDMEERAQMPMLSEYDPDLAAMIRREVERQRHGIELIASENFVSEAVMEAMGTPLVSAAASSARSVCQGARYSVLSGGSGMGAGGSTVNACGSTRPG